MVLHLASSPLVARSTSTTTTSSASTSSNNNSGSTTSSSIFQLSFLSDMSKGNHHHRQRNRQRTASTSRSLHSAFSSQTQKDKQLSSLFSSSAYLRTIVKTIVRLAGFCSALYPILIVPTLRTKGLKDGFGGGTQYLTIVGLLVTMVCIGLGIAGDAFKQPGLVAAKNRILPMLVPVECVIAGLYWYLVLTNVFHIYPDGHKYLPFHIDIQMHGIPFLTGLVEMFFFSETLRIHRIKDVCYYILFAVFYSSWSSFCAHMDGEWPYPVLQNQASDWERYSMMVNATMVGLAIHFIISEAHIRTTTKASH